MKNILELLIDDFHERSLPALLPRNQSMPRVQGKANVVTGMRRAGKTWFCYQQMQELMDKGTPKEHILYLNFEDERLLPFTARDFQLVLDTYFRKLPSHKDQLCHLFLDEAQRIEGWELFVRRVLDTERMTVCVTGSSSRLLSREIATALRGRSLTTEIFPFSFREFLQFHKADIPGTGNMGSRRRAVVQNLAGRYLDTGGFPEVQSVDDDMRRQILRNYVDVVLLRDVVERCSVQNTTALRALIRAVLSAPATRFSVNRFYNTLRSQGVSCTKNSLYDYLDHLTDAFLLYQAPIHSRSERIRQVNPGKVYAVDPGLIGATSFGMTGDRGALLENVAYMHLRRQGIEPEYYVTEGGGEVDFVFTGLRDDKRHLIQACWHLSAADTQQREVEALLAAMAELRVKEATIVTWLDEEPVHEHIEVVPAWRWLLSET